MFIDLHIQIKVINCFLVNRRIMPLFLDLFLFMFIY